MIRAFKSKGTDLAKLAEAMVAHKAGDNFSILRCHRFLMQPLVRQHPELSKFDAVDEVLLIGFLAQAMVSVTRLLCEPASSTETKFITDAMQKLTLTVIRWKDGERRFVLSNFNPLNEAVLSYYGFFLEASTM